MCPDAVNPSWTFFICESYSDYQRELDSLAVKGFVRYEDPSFPKELPHTKKLELEAMVTSGIDVVRMTHFDEEGRRMDGLYETYIKCHSM